MPRKLIVLAFAALLAGSNVPPAVGVIEGRVTFDGRQIVFVASAGGTQQL